VKTKTATEIGQIRELLPSWRISLQAGNRSPNTLATYTTSVEMFATYLEANGMPAQVASIKREHVESFLAWMIERYKPASVRNRYTGIRRFFDWCLEEGEVTSSPLRNIPPPAIPENPPPVLSDDQLRALLKTCAGKTFEDRRDTAIVWMFLSTGIRLAELSGLAVGDVDLETRTVTVLGKGRRVRTVGLNLKGSQGLDRYLRIRRSHPQASLAAVWLGLRGPMTPSGVRQVLERRGAEAGIEGLHPHLLRHTWAHKMLATGHEETNVMQLAGWRSRQMLNRYGASAAGERAIAAQQRLDPYEKL
jgi:site-specific recombinase XerD